jgi:hypothetical protein
MIPTSDEQADRDDVADAIASHETGNLLLLALHQILWRIGWTFKTESIIVPAILDTIAGPRASGWLRGFLPLASRLGQSVPPIFSVEVLQAARRKKWVLAATAILVSLPYLLFAVLWFGAGGGREWMALVILVLHFAFFVFYGLYQVASGTVQGKLIGPTRRGRLLWGATFFGLVPTVLFCLWLMPEWLAQPMPGFGYLFLFVAGCFSLSTLAICALAEPADGSRAAPAPVATSLATTLGVLRRDGNLRWLIVVIFVFGLGLVTIPHYQNYLKTSLGLQSKALVFMVIVHTTAVSFYSVVVGPAADRWGYRLTLRLLVFGAAAAPVYVLCLPMLTAHAGQVFASDTPWLATSGGRLLVALVFVPLALTPLVPTVLMNYALELCPTAEHPRYVSLVNLAMMPPYLLSPLVGTLVDWAGFRPVAVATAVLMLACGAMTFWLDEPRAARPCRALR